MKIITLNLNETHALSDNVQLTITDIRGRHASVGIDAPRDIHIRRSELSILKAHKPARPYLAA